MNIKEESASLVEPSRRDASAKERFVAHVSYVGNSLTNLTDLDFFAFCVWEFPEK
jgi:hypothetical protein